jgi:hypothetical protein
MIDAYVSRQAAGASARGLCDRGVTLDHSVEVTLIKACKLQPAGCWTLLGQTADSRVLAGCILQLLQQHLLHIVTLVSDTQPRDSLMQCHHGHPSTPACMQTPGVLVVLVPRCSSPNDWQT